MVHLLLSLKVWRSRFKIKNKSELHGCMTRSQGTTLGKFRLAGNRHLITAGRTMEKNLSVDDALNVSLPAKFGEPLSAPNGLENDAGQGGNEIPETPGSTEAAVAAVAAAMEQEATMEQDDAATAVATGDSVNPAEPPAKRRRGGRRVSNPDVSAEERRRIRVLKNRESAMRSLVKKAEYSAKLVDLQKAAEAEHLAKYSNLQKLVAAAIELRNDLEKISSDEVRQLCEELTNCITRSSAADVPVMAEGLPPKALDTSPPHPEPKVADAAPAQV